MTKHYSEQLAKWVEQKQSRRRDQNLVSFLAVKTDVLDALADGYAAKTIWMHLSETQRIDFGYDTFLSYIKRQIREHSKAGAEASKAEKQQCPKNERTTETKHPASFSFNSVPNKEELL